jgi:putative transposase
VDRPRRFGFEAELTPFGPLARLEVMPRKARCWEPGAILHVVARAHCGAPIFATDADRAFLVARAARVFREEGVECFAWSVLSNHYHMLARFREPPQRPMQRLNTAVGIRVRRFAGGRGAAFQDRYFGKPREDTTAVLNGLAYVMANPIHHRIVPSVAVLASDEWSSLGEVTGRRPARLANPAAALSLLDAPRGREIESLLDLLEVRVRMWDEQDAARPVERHSDVDAPIDGDPDPPESADGVARAAGLKPQGAIAARRDALCARGWTPDALIVAACGVTGARPNAVRGGSRQHAASRARAIVAYVACEHLGWPALQVARCVAVSASSAVEARARGPAVLAAAHVTAVEVLRRAGVPA